MRFATPTQDRETGRWSLIYDGEKIGFDQGEDSEFVFEVKRFLDDPDRQSFDTLQDRAQAMARRLRWQMDQREKAREIPATVEQDRSARPVMGLRVDNPLKGKTLEFKSDRSARR
jgi:hypothetical protein